jgi:hypothetical protein
MMQCRMHDEYINLNRTLVNMRDYSMLPMYLPTASNRRQSKDEPPCRCADGARHFLGIYHIKMQLSTLTKFHHSESFTTQGIAPHRAFRHTGYFTAQGVSPHRVFHHTGSLTTQGVSPYREFHHAGMWVSSLSSRVLHPSLPKTSLYD